MNADARSVRNVEDLLADSPNTRRAHERFFAELARLQADVAAAGARLVVMVLPMQAQVEGRSRSRLPQERVSAYCHEHGIRYLDPLPALRGATGLFEDVVHFTPDARARVAEYLLSTGLIPEERGRLGALSRLLSRAAEDAPAASLVTALREARVPLARAEAAWLLGRREPGAWTAGAVQALLSALRDPSEAVRAEAARALGRTGERTARVAGALCQALSDPRQSVRWRAIEALVALSPPFEVLWPGLESSLRHPDVHVRAGAAFCLRGAGPGAAAAARAVRALVKDVDPGVRVVAIRALPELGAADAETVAALEGALRGRGEVDDVRRQAARALGRLREHALSAVPALVDALRDANGLLRVEAATALGLIRPPQPDVVPALVAATADEGATVRRAAALALGRIGAVEPARAALLRLQDDEDDDVREAARRVLSTSAGPRER